MNITRKIRVVGGTYVDTEVAVEGAIRADVSLKAVSRIMNLGGPGYCHATRLAELGISVELYTALGTCEWSERARVSLGNASVSLIECEPVGVLDQATVLLDEHGAKLTVNDYRRSTSIEAPVEMFAACEPILIASPTSIDSMVIALNHAEEIHLVAPVVLAPHSVQVKQLSLLGASEWQLLGRAVRLCCVSESDFIPEIEARLPRDTTLIITKGERGCSVRTDGAWSNHSSIERIDNAVNSNGAGEAFLAGVIFEWIAGEDIERAIYKGSRNAVRYLQRQRNTASPTQTKHSSSSEITLP